MSHSSSSMASRPVYYLDTNVLLNLFKGLSRPNDSREAKRFIKRIHDGKAEGVISTWVLMEIITVVRRYMIGKKKNRPDISDVEMRVQKILAGIYKIKNLRVVSGTPLEMAGIGRIAPLAWEVFEKAHMLLSGTIYDINWNRYKGRHTLIGIGSNDALHIILATYFGCDYLATFDKGFWTDKGPIDIYDVKANKVR